MEPLQNDTPEKDDAELLAHLTGRRYPGGSLWSYPGQPLHEAFLRLEAAGKVRRKIDREDAVYWEAAPEAGPVED